MSAQPIKKVIIVGCGIAGLTLAVALRKRNVAVEMLEKAHQLGEVGAAISLAPNSTRILNTLNFDPKLARCTDAGPSIEYNEDGVEVDRTDLTKVCKDVGSPWWWVHRADLHAELVRLATEAEFPEWGPKTVIRLGSSAVEVDVDAGSIKDQNGNVYTADLIVGGDGVHSVVRHEVSGHQELKSVYSGHSAYRALFDVEELRNDPELKAFVEPITMQDWVAKDGRRCLLYACRDNTLLNLFAPTFMDASESIESWRATGKNEDLVNAFSMFPERLQKLLRKAGENPPLWQIRDRDPVRGWHKGKAVLIGDAAHAMLPHQGQGGAQAIEDAATLPVFLFDGPESQSLSDRLQAFEDFRYPRASAVQNRSRAQKAGPKERPGKLPSIEIWSKIYEQAGFNVVNEALAAVRAKN